VSCSFMRVMLRQIRCSPLGTKLKISSLAINRRTNRSASLKSCLRPHGWKTPAPSANACGVPVPARPTASTGPSTPWKPQSNAPEAGDAAQRFRVTHPYHPLFGQSLELAAQAREWGEERVYYRDPTGRMRFLPARWTSVAAPDPFILIAADRAHFRLEDLIRLHDRLKQLQGRTSHGACLV
jgi:hypothetical protein